MAAYGGGIVPLNEEQQRKLAKLIYYQEVEAINDIQFHSEPELAKYLGDCKSSHQAVLKILDAGGDVKAKYKDDTAKASIAHDTYETLSKGVSFALQCVRNFVLRLNYLDKLHAHAVETRKALAAVDANDVAAVGRLAKDAARYKRAVLRYTEKYRNLPSKVVAYFTEHNIKPKELLQWYQAKLGLPAVPFEELETSQQLKVYNKILTVSEEGEEIMTAYEVLMGGASLAVLHLTAAFLICDIITSQDKIQTASRDAVMAIAPYGGTMIGEVVSATLEVELVGIVEVSSLFVGVIGFGAGIFAGLILSAIGNHLLDLIFGTGGSSGGSAVAPSRAPPPPPPVATEGHRFYRAQLPDGHVLARQMVHNKN